MPRVFLALPWMLWSLTCVGHGSADNHLQIMLVDDRIKMNITVDMRVLQSVDADRDGYASLAELRERGQSLRDWMEDAFDVTDQHGKSGTVVFADVTSDLNIARELGGRVDHARILQTLQFAEAPAELQLNFGVLAALVPELRVTVIDAESGLTYRLRDPARKQTVPMP